MTLTKSDHDINFEKSHLGHGGWIYNRNDEIDFMIKENYSLFVKMTQKRYRTAYVQLILTACFVLVL